MSQGVQSVNGTAPALGSLEWASKRLASLAGQPTDKVRQALAIAADAHSGQRRQCHPGLPPVPFIVHPVEVAVLCGSLAHESGVPLPPQEVLICAALLHDTVEDCEIPVSTLQARVGQEVTALVVALTKPRLKEHEAAEARMDRFCQQIREASAPAIFLKCCDLLHNLAERETTPISVLRKTVEKGVRYYAPLLYHAEFSAEFKARVRHALIETEAALAAASPPNADDPLYLRLHRMLAATQARKTEVHDAVELLHESLETDEVAVVRFPRLRPPVIVAGRLSVPMDAGRLETIRQTAQARGGFTGLKASMFRTQSAPAPTDVAYFACVEHGLRGADTLVVCGLRGDWKKSAERGLAPEIVMRIVLGAVLRPTAELHRALTEEALGLGMELDLGMALEVDVQRGQLRELARWRHAADLACQHVEAEIRSFLHAASLESPLWRRVRIETRVKSITSILQKFARYPELRWPNFAAVEDIAGVRVICPMAWHVDRLANFVTRPGGPPVSQLRRFDLKPTPEGYRGIHAVRQVTILGQEQPIPCEIQLRTTLQDAWATVSHTFAYKEAGGDRHVPALRELSERLAGCDAVIGGILADREDGNAKTQFQGEAREA